MKDLFQSPLVNVLLLSIFWAVEILNTKLAFLAGAQLVQFSIQSVFLTLLILAFYVLPKKLKELKKISFHTFKWLFIANAIHMGIGGFFSNAGIQYTTAINAGFLMQFAIVTTAIFAWILLKEKMTASKVISILVIMIGTFLLITKGQLIIPHIGDLLLLLACIAWGLGGVLLRKIFKTTSVSSDIVSLFKPVSGIPVILLFIALSPLYPPTLQKVFQVNIFEFNYLGYVIVNSALTAILWVFVNRTLKVASASYMIMMSSITPILVAILAMIFLQEKIVGIQFVGILLIIASSFVVHFLKFDKH